ncbi:MAG: fluoride efflux transporter CrcB [Planctomycetota bacterium]
MREVLLVGAGGFVGAVLRYGAVRALGATAFPWATLSVNVVGSLALGWALSLSARDALSPDVRVALCTGLLGALTTFSTFSAETVRLAQAGSLGAAALNAALNVSLSIAAAAAGFALGR